MNWGGSTWSTLGEGEDPECSDHQPASTAFAGTLDELASRHPDYDNGVRIATAADHGFTTSLRLAATVVDDNRAQGSTTDFWIVLEARP